MTKRKKIKLRFRKRNGRTFTKTFNSYSSAKRAVKAWRAAGGRMAKKTRKRGRRR